MIYTHLKVKREATSETGEQKGNSGMFSSQNISNYGPSCQILNYFPIFHEGRGLVGKFLGVNCDKDMETTKPRLNRLDFLRF